MQLVSARCESARRLVSLDLDGELSRFERAMLGRHLRRCADCAECARRTVAITQLLRSVPLEEIRLPTDAYRRPHRRGRALAMGTATFAAVLVGALFSVRSAGNEPARLLASPRLPAVENFSEGRFDWPAGLPRNAHIVQFVPGGRFTFGTNS
jgi:anti-sigma factor RsiW